MNKKTAVILVALAVFIWLGFKYAPTLRTYFLLTYRHIPNTPEAQQIMDTIQSAYDIEVEAAYTFDLSKFPTVFINDPRFPLHPAVLETVRELTNNPTLKTAGWLDYKMAYRSWTRDSILHTEDVFAKAKAENRELTQEERESLTDSYGRTAPARTEKPTRNYSVKFISMKINKDIAFVIVNDGPTTSELTLVLVDGQWYIAGLRGISVHP